MSIVINTNTTSIMAQRSLANATNSMNTQIQRLSTGSKINKAADDAAGLSIAKGLDVQVKGSTVASANAQAGINLLQTAEGDLGIIQDNLQRIRDLTVQAANGTYSDTEKTAIKTEVEARLSEINRIAKGSAFNKIKLLDNSPNKLSLQIGTNAEGSVNSLDISSALQSALASNLSTAAVGANKLNNATVETFFSDPTKTASFLTVVDDAIATVSSRRSGIGAYQNRLNSAISSLSVKSENLSSAESRIQDTDIADTASQLTKYQILQKTSTSLLTQANATPQIALSLLGAS